MRLGMHTYRYHHGIAEDWAGFQLPWPRQMDIWQLMDYMVEIGLEGLHLDDKAFDSLDVAHFSKVREYAAERHLYLEYNFAMPSKKYDSSVQHDIEEGIAIAQAIGADVAKMGEGDLDMKRAYKLIQQSPEVNRINIELDLKCPMDNMQAALMLICITGFGCLLAASDTADDEHGRRGYFEREDQHSLPFWETDNEGNETAGQIAAWLLLVANLPVALSILIKWMNRSMPLGAALKKSLANLNRMQKKSLMWLHYYLNLAILGIALWHWLASRCKSSALPELGLMAVVILITLGFLMKFKSCPNAFRKKRLSDSYATSG